MDFDVIAGKIDTLIKCIQRIELKTPENLTELQENIDAQDIIMLNLERAIQTCIDIGTHILAKDYITIPKTMAEVFCKLHENGIISKALSKNLSASVGFRNIAVHDYQEIDLNIVYSIITKHLTDFKEFASIIEKHL